MLITSQGGRPTHTDMDLVDRFKSMMRQSAQRDLEQLAAKKSTLVKEVKSPNLGERAIADTQSRIVSPLPLVPEVTGEMQSALDRVRREKPDYQGSDEQFYEAYKRHGQKLLSELPSENNQPSMGTPVTPATGGSVGKGMVSGTPKQYASLVMESAKKHGVPERLLSALLQQESGFNPNAQSPVGAMGIAQFMPATAKGLGIDPLDPLQAIPAAAQYLKRSFDKFGSWELALAAYNAGGGAVGKYGGIPPYPETQNYVKSIMGAAR